MIVVAGGAACIEPLSSLHYLELHSHVVASLDASAIGGFHEILNDCDALHIVEVYRLGHI